MHSTLMQPPDGGRAALRTPLLVVVCFAVAAPLAILAAAVGETRHPALMLAVLAIGAFAVGCAAEPVGSVLIGLLFWLFYDGFVVNRSGVLAWDGRTDALRLAVLVGAGLLGSLLGLLVRRIRRTSRTRERSGR